MAFYRSGRGEGSFERGIEMALRGVLANPKFLLRAESSATGVQRHSIWRRASPSFSGAASRTMS